MKELKTILTVFVHSPWSMVDGCFKRNNNFIQLFLRILRSKIYAIPSRFHRLLTIDHRPQLFQTVLFVFLALQIQAQTPLIWEKPVSATKSERGVYEVETEEVEFVLKAADTLRDARVKIFRNGKKLNTGAKSEADELYFYVIGNRVIGTLQLLPGHNDLRIEVYESRNTVAASETIRVEKRKSNLYVLSIGTSPPDLDYPEIDACDLGNVFRGQAAGQRRLYGHVEVETLLGDDATAENMEIALNKLAENETIRDNDLVIIFFSAHGDLNDKKEFYIQGDNYRRSAKKHTTMLGSDIFDILNDISCRKMVFFDACHSGAKGVGDDEDINDAVQKLLSPMKGYTVISSSGKHEKSHEDKKWKNGAFTEFLLKGLEGEADSPEQPDGIISIYELYEYLSEKVPKAVGALKQKPQHPQLITDSLGNLPFFLTENYDMAFTPCGNGIKNTLKDADKLYKTVYVEGGILNTVRRFGGKNMYVRMEPIKVPAFSMGVYEVTNAQYCKFLNAHTFHRDRVQWLKLKSSKCKILRKGASYAPKEGSERLPVVTVSWEGAMKYAQWLSRKTGLIYRLPTEYEWEYAAHSGHHFQDMLYSGSTIIDSIGWYEENSANKLHQVGFRQSNKLGIHDLSGNAAEWCLDKYERLDNDVPDKEKADWRDVEYMVRGGHFSSPALDCQNKSRAHYPGNAMQPYIGFRLVRVAN